MDIIEQARALGKAIQQEDMFKELMQKKNVVETDTVLQDNIGNFNLKRLAINEEAGKPDRDNEKMQKLNEELRDLYAEIMRNENMISLEKIKAEMTEVVQRIVAIITHSAEGEDPETADYTANCSGSCQSCGGC